jgi:hypothetical protein
LRKRIEAAYRELGIPLPHAPASPAPPVSLTLKGRDPGFPDVTPLAATQATVGVTADFECGVAGTASVTMYESIDRRAGGPRGGIALRLTMPKSTGCALPTCEQLPDGVIIHLPGADEAQAWVNAILAVLPYRQHSKFPVVGELPPAPEAAA